MSASATAKSFYEVEPVSLGDIRQLHADLLLPEWPDIGSELCYKITEGMGILLASDTFLFHLSRVGEVWICMGS